MELAGQGVEEGMCGGSWGAELGQGRPGACGCPRSPGSWVSRLSEGCRVLVWLWVWAAPGGRREREQGVCSRGNSQPADSEGCLQEALPKSGGPGPDSWGAGLGSILGTPPAIREMLGGTPDDTSCPPGASFLQLALDPYFLHLNYNPPTFIPRPPLSPLLLLINCKPMSLCLL